MTKSVKETDSCVTTSTEDGMGRKLLDPKTFFKELHQKAMTMGIKQHQLNKLRYVRDIKQAKWERKQAIVVKIILASLCFGVSMGFVWLLDWPIPQRNLARALWTLRGKNTLFAKSEKCLLKASKTAQDFTRPPISCEFCEGVEKVTRVSAISPEEFRSRFAYSGQPVVVTDGAANWSAVETFSFDFFKELYRPGSLALRNAEELCQFFPYKTEFRHLGEVFQMDRDRSQLKDGAQPWYVGWSNCDMSAANDLRRHYRRPYFLPETSESSKTDWIFMGSPGYGAHMHIDNVRLPSWQAQITGHKTWTLQPPSECYFRCSSIAVTVHPGEIIVLDTNKWFHSTLVVGHDISIVIGSEYD